MEAASQTRQPREEFEIHGDAIAAPSSQSRFIKRWRKKSTLAGRSSRSTAAHCGTNPVFYPWRTTCGSFGIDKNTVAIAIKPRRASGRLPVARAIASRSRAGGGGSRPVTASTTKVTVAHQEAFVDCTASGLAARGRARNSIQCERSTLQDLCHTVSERQHRPRQRSGGRYRLPARAEYCTKAAIFVEVKVMTETLGSDD